MIDSLVSEYYLIFMIFALFFMSNIEISQNKSIVIWIGIVALGFLLKKPVLLFASQALKVSSLFRRIIYFENILVVLIASLYGHNL